MTSKGSMTAESGVLSPFSKQIMNKWFKIIALDMRKIKCSKSTPHLRSALLSKASAQGIKQIKER